MAKIDTKSKLAEAQKNYDALAEKAKASITEDKSLRLQLEVEMRDKLKSRGVDRDELMKQKLASSKELEAAKQQRIGEIVSAVAADDLSIEEATAELQSYGYTPSAAAIELRRVTASTPTQIQDPVDAAKKDSEVVEYVDGPNEEKHKAARKARK